MQRSSGKTGARPDGHTRALIAQAIIGPACADTGPSKVRMSSEKPFYSQCITGLARGSAWPLRPAGSGEGMTPALARKYLAVVAEGFEFERVPGWVAKEQCGLFTCLSGKADLRRDQEIRIQLL